MKSIYELRLKNHDTYLCDTISQLLSRLDRIASVEPVHLKPLQVSFNDQKPELRPLVDAGLLGTFAHRVRFNAAQAGLEPKIVCHELSGQIVRTTETVSYDIVSEFDPDYLIQSALYSLAFGGHSVEKGGEWVERILASQIEYERITAEDADIITSIHDWKSFMYAKDGNDVSHRGSAFSVVSWDMDLDHLPRIARQTFEKLALKAYPAGMAMAPENEEQVTVPKL